MVADVRHDRPATTAHNRDERHHRQPRRPTVSDEPMAQAAPEELDPRAKAVQEVALAEQRVSYARRDRDRAVKRVGELETALAKARAVAADALGVRESELAGLR
jgi:hypothetical protein